MWEPLIPLICVFLDYVGATVYSLPAPVEFRVDCSCCVYIFFKSQDGLCFVVQDFFHTTNQTQVCVLRFCVTSVI